MTDQMNEEKKKERKKVLTGLLLTAMAFAWFLFYLISSIPD
jgi:hypothetical protein